MQIRFRVHGLAFKYCLAVWTGVSGVSEYLLWNLESEPTLPPALSFAVLPNGRAFDIPGRIGSLIMRMGGPPLF